MSVKTNVEEMLVEKGIITRAQLERVKKVQFDHTEILQLNKPIMRCRPDKACFFNVKFFVLYYSILWYFL